MTDRKQVQEVLSALGEEFLVDIPAEHNSSGDYKLDYFLLVRFLVNASDEWADRIAGYINTRGQFDNGINMQPVGGGRRNDPQTPYPDPYLQSWEEANT
jgi:hypothetical protein